MSKLSKVDYQSRPWEYHQKFMQKFQNKGKRQVQDIYFSLRRQRIKPKASNISTSTTPVSPQPTARNSLLCTNQLLPVPKNENKVLQEQYNNYIVKPRELGKQFIKQLMHRRPPPLTDRRIIRNPVYEQINVRMQKDNMTRITPIDSNISNQESMYRVSTNN